MNVLRLFIIITSKPSFMGRDFGAEAIQYKIYKNLTLLLTNAR